MEIQMDKWKKKLVFIAKLKFQSWIRMSDQWSQESIFGTWVLSHRNLIGFLICCIIPFMVALLDIVDDFFSKSGLKILFNVQDILWRLQLIVVHPKFNEQLLPWKQSTVSLDLELVAKLEDEVAHHLVTINEGIEVDLDNVAWDSLTCFSKVPESANSSINIFLDFFEIHAASGSRLIFLLFKLTKDLFLLAQLQNFKAASYFSSTKEVQSLNEVWRLYQSGYQVIQSCKFCSHLIVLVEIKLEPQQSLSWILLFLHK